jgi:hypothetical protein
MAADQLGDGGPLDRAYASWPVHAHIYWRITDNCSRINPRLGISLCGGLYLRGAIPYVCKHHADGAAYAGVRRTIRLGHDSVAMASYATRAWPGNIRVESAKVEPSTVAERDHSYHFWISALLLLSSIRTDRRGATSWCRLIARPDAWTIKCQAQTVARAPLSSTIRQSSRGSHGFRLHNSRYR